MLWSVSISASALLFDPAPAGLLSAWIMVELVRSSVSSVPSSWPWSFVSGVVVGLAPGGVLSSTGVGFDASAGMGFSRSWAPWLVLPLGSPVGVPGS